MINNTYVHVHRDTYIHMYMYIETTHTQIYTVVDYTQIYITNHTYTTVEYITHTCINIYMVITNPFTSLIKRAF